ncbi:deoxyguanosinetriphosphate triphosphohydrolase-like domain protein [Mycobacterium xenopi 4042]|uniref:Deoxyguanosinetriphosphate triphosphohydrolase-like domain protein n=1 Tax=Mycobacterium xenopi 4042 TaxID=1299334 RepID=X8AQJ2_MYCXE|nr:deoxyguanosinetriphosphate triphosphohydrolase-like domain protein [Mycobacterium xenopi 4042]
MQYPARSRAKSLRCWSCVPSSPAVFGASATRRWRSKSS